MPTERNASATLDELAGDYDVVRELGRGGMAVVYLAREHKTGALVAIKVIRAKYVEDEEALARFSREARFVSHLQHPHIVPIQAVRRLADGSVALVMEHVPGRTLKQVIREDGSLPFSRAEQVLREIGAALAYAHARGIVHRDVKPENIFLDERTGRALLADFGIARSIHSETHLTLSGVAIGTPTYMSPEQIDGGAVDGRSDLYSLGIVAWEMLAGKRPWDGESLYSVIYRQKNDYLPPLDELRPKIPERLLVAIEGLLEKDPGERWRDADEFLSELSAEIPKPRVPRYALGQPESTETMRVQRKWASPSSAVPAAGAPAAAAPPSAIVAPPAAIERTEGPRPMAALRELMDEDAFTDDENLFATGGFSRRGRYTALALAALLLVAAVGVLYMLARTSPDVSQQVALLEGRSSDAPRETPSPRPPDSATSVPGREVVGSAGTLDSSDAAVRSRASSDSAVGARDTAAARTDTSAVARADTTARPDAPPPVEFDTRSRRGAPPVASGRSGPPPAPSVTPPVRAPDPARASPPATPPPAASAAPQPAPVAAAPSESRTASGERFRIVPGGVHTCFLAPDGRAFCWGGNDDGQLGTGTGGRSSTPVALAGDFRFASLAPGLTHTCAVSRSGAAYCWGNNERGQLGDGTSAGRSSPVRVQGGRTFRTVVTGAAHSCGLDRDGAVSCWGGDEHGQLGDGATLDRAYPTPVATGIRFTAIVAGWNHTCALDSSGRAYCWGQNSAGQLGDSSTSGRNMPTPVLGDLRFVGLAAGSTHTCGITGGGEVYCWGRNRFGQLGDGTVTDRPIPTRVRSTSRFTAITAGGVHSCALTREGEAHCWGRNTYGQLGDGATVDKAVPGKVVGTYAFAAISAFGSHTCATTVTGESFCWGYNLEGQLGDGSRAHAVRPRYVERPN